MTYLLDTMIVSYFLQAEGEDDLAAAASRCPMAIADEVRRELENDPKRGGRPFKRWLATTSITVLPIEVGSGASDLLAQLLNPASPDKHRGERASIALAAFDTSLTLVTNDKGATTIALRELWKSGEHVLGLPVFLRRLFEQTAPSDPVVLDEVMKFAQAPRPTWWASFRAGLASSNSIAAPLPQANGASET